MLAANRESSCSLTRAIDGRIHIYSFMPISCYFRDCKALLLTNLSHVRRAIESTELYLYLLSCRHVVFIEQSSY